MLTIVQRGGATREKPPEVVRGYSSRLPWAWDGLCFAVPFNDNTRDSARDLVHNAAPSSFGGTLQWRKDNRGNVALGLDSLSSIDYAYDPAHNRPTTEVTAYVRMRRAGTGGTPRGIFIKVWNLTLDPVVSWCIQDSDAANNTLAGNLGVGGVQNYWEAPGYTVGTTDWISVFLRWRSGEAPSLDILGERGQVLTSAVPGWTLTGTIPYTTGQPIRLNTFDADGATNYNADYSQAMLWARRLTDVEVQAIVADPYGWYSPRRATIVSSSPYPLLFGGGEMRHGTGSGGLR